ncbi:L-erythro-3,5-diaminohexanoate dehydrogenase [Actinoplanes sp. NPDC051633]|uniref:L-erythro-3,5-diaminohexanoate dehydrogenase n=1 Tax=Actinoplanes sp. NPDC051633 TaxID=3155670 RepID=UPI00344228B9
MSVGLTRVLEPAGVLPQAAWRLDARPEIAADEVRIRVERLNLDAASFRQLAEKHGGDGAAVRAEVLEIIGTRGKMQNPVTGSGGMLIGVVDEVGPSSPLPVKPGDRVATLVSLTLTPLAITDGLAGWDGLSEQVPAAGHAILFGRSVVAVLPDDLPPELALAVFDVCGAPALTDRVVRRYTVVGQEAVDAPDALVGYHFETPTVAVLGGAGKSGSLALAAARLAGARTVGIVVSAGERDLLEQAGLADHVAIADARDPVQVSEAVSGALGGPATVTVVCVDVPGCEHGAILATAPGGTVIFFSMATSFAAAALGAEGLAADVTMLIGNGYVPGHAAFALDVLRKTPAVRALYEQRIAGH